MIRLKRVYEPPTTEDGLRILVERLWPRGLTKQQARVDVWLKAIAPSASLRTWFQHDPAKWQEFCRRYRAELKRNATSVKTLKALAQRRTVTLVFAARDEQHNSATALMRFLSR